MEKETALTTQMEYYLSDGNLKRDTFFYGKIAEDAEGFVDIDLFLNCNKIKALNATKEQIATDCKLSGKLEVSACNNRIRRKGNKELPEPEFKKNKKLKVEEKPEGVVVPEKEKDAEEKVTEAYPTDQFIPLILFIRDTTQIEGVFGKEAEEIMAKALGTDVPFIRIGKYDGNIVFDKNVIPPQVLSDLLQNGFELKGTQIKLDLGSDRDRQGFMKEHGRHVGKLIKRSKAGLSRIREGDGQPHQGGRRQEEVPWEDRLLWS